MIDMGAHCDQTALDAEEELVPLHDDARASISQTAIVLCVVSVCVMLAAVVIALAGDPRGAGSVVFLALLIGTILGCVFHKRWR